MSEQHEPDWIDDVHARGLGGALRVALDALAPLGPLGAQLLYIAQPTLGLFGLREAAHDIALALEDPGGLDAIRARLDDETRLDSAPRPPRGD